MSGVKFNRTSVRFRRWAFLGLLLATTGVSPAIHAAEPLSLEQLQERLDQLEQDNNQLRERLDVMESDALSEAVEHETDLVFQENEMPPVVSEDQVREVVSGMMQTQSAADHQFDYAQEQKIISLEKSFKDFVAKANTKKYPTAVLYGVFQADAGWFDQDQGSRSDYGPISSGADIRRFRLGAKGQITEHTNYAMQVDFGFFGRPTIQDLYVEQTDVPIFGNVRVGQWKQPFSLEVVSSFRYTTFMERSVLFQAFTPFRHLGVGFYDWTDDLNMTYAASVFAAGQDQYAGSMSLSGGYASAERITYLPMWECDGHEYVHLGLGHYFSTPNNHVTNLRTLPEAFIGTNPASTGTSGQGVSGSQNGTPFFVSTGNIYIDCFNVIGTEFLWVNHRWSLQSETMVNFVSTRDHAADAVFSQTNQGTAILPGTYAQLGYFLTDDYRPYDRKAGAIDRIIPKHSMAFCNGNCCSPGWGAWEVAARFSYLDLNANNATNVRGGNITDYTLGLNWYTTPYTKLVFNYVHSVSDPGTAPIGTPPYILNTNRANTNIFMTRMQVDF
ncbi:porin [Planctomicrobium piriforme]|uniref:Phosphate-selective porin OprO and OprP n=1 Tax=Planctomicrobium piriforme TaxID=1576369 RepID=A0A1I3CEG4_9PLAN|nr:porin [Planctomicrobium piriforme]SFH72609.1 phosphate-selective porin OprO and OprP [Planctomicrobium piriforme]